MVGLHVNERDRFSFWPLHPSLGTTVGRQEHRNKDGVGHQFCHSFLRLGQALRIGQALGFSRNTRSGLPPFSPSPSVAWSSRHGLEQTLGYRRKKESGLFPATMPPQAHHIQTNGCSRAPLPYSASMHCFEEGCCVVSYMATLFMLLGELWVMRCSKRSRRRS